MPAVAAPASKSKYLLKKEQFSADDELLAPHYRALLEVQQAWFSGCPYSDKEQLLDAAAAGPGAARDFIRYFLALRNNPASRIPFAQFCADVQNKGRDEKGKTRHYWRALVGRIWDHYLSAPRMPKSLLSFLVFVPSFL